MKFVLLRIVKITREDGRFGYVVQEHPPWWIIFGWFSGWSHTNGLIYPSLAEAEDYLRFAEYWMNGVKGEVVK